MGRWCKGFWEYDNRMSKYCLPPPRSLLPKVPKNGKSQKMAKLFQMHFLHKHKCLFLSHILNWLIKNLLKNQNTISIINTFNLIYTERVPECSFCPEYTFCARLKYVLTLWVAPVPSFNLIHTAFFPWRCKVIVFFSFLIFFFVLGLETVAYWILFRIRIRLIRIRPKISIRIRIPDPGSGFRIQTLSNL